MITTTFLKPSYAVLVLLLVYTNINAQNVLVASGGNGSNSYGSLYYSVGQTIQETLMNANGIVIQGIQMKFNSSTLGINDLVNAIEVTTYPNPTSSILNLKFRGDFKNELNYELINILGQTVLKGPITCEITKIDIVTLPITTYLLNIIYQENNIVKTFKIIKN